MFAARAVLVPVSLLALAGVGACDRNAPTTNAGDPPTPAATDPADAPAADAPAAPAMPDAVGEDPEADAPETPGEIPAACADVPGECMEGCEPGWVQYDGELTDACYDSICCVKEPGESTE